MFDIGTKTGGFKPFLAFLIFFLFNDMALFGAPKSDLWPRWEKHDASSAAVIDHSAWDEILAKYLDAKHSSGVNRFNYKAVTAADKKKLKRYLQDLQNTKIGTFNRPEQFAYWVNLYNALTVDLVLDEYPVKSITKIGGLFSFGPWNNKIAKVDGQKMSLNDIEHRILRPIWKDARIHYAVNCASYGCPNLASKAYTAKNSEEILEEGARDYVNHARGASFKGGELTLSSIYDWYKVDFGVTDKGVIEHLKKYAKPDLLKKLNAHKGGFDDNYDWNLNQP